MGENYRFLHTLDSSDINIEYYKKNFEKKNKNNTRKEKTDSKEVWKISVLYQCLGFAECNRLNMVFLCM